MPKSLRLQTLVVHCLFESLIRFFDCDQGMVLVWASPVARIVIADCCFSRVVRSVDNQRGAVVFHGVVKYIASTLAIRLARAFSITDILPHALFFSSPLIFSVESGCFDGQYSVRRVWRLGRHFDRQPACGRGELQPLAAIEHSHVDDPGFQTLDLQLLTCRPVENVEVYHIAFGCGSAVGKILKWAERGAVN